MADETYAVPPPPRATLPVVGTDAVFPIHRVYCVGRNYADHAVEMGHDPDREPPFFFQKNPDDVTGPGVDFRYPARSGDVHHEVELVVALASGGRDIPVGRAMDHVFGYAVGLDMTRRDLQAAAKKAGRPWEVAKAFEGSAPCSAILPAPQAGDVSRSAVRVSVDGVLRQSGTVGQMIWSIPEIIAELSTLFPLAAGDLIFTGTPAGVGAVKRGDRLEATVEGVGALHVTVV
jgi:fumarylpyruvate hydrolase